MALAETSARQPALALVHPEDERPIEPDPAHHADRLGPQARALSLALCRDWPRSRGSSHRGSRSLGPTRFSELWNPELGLQRRGGGEVRGRMGALPPAKK